MGKKVVITGASGMVGSHVLDLCLESDAVAAVVSIVRRPSGTADTKLQELIVPDLTSYTPTGDEFADVDAAFFCIGVYTGAVARDEFRKITVDIPVTFAQMLHKESPQAKFCLLSGAGADRSEQSRMMFAKDKGAAENQLSAIGFRSFHTFRPGYIYPVVPRKEPNLSYRIFRLLYPLIGGLMGPNSSIKSTDLAQGIFNVGISDQKEAEILENHDILDLA